MHKFGCNELTRESLLSNLAEIRHKDNKGVSSRPATRKPVAEQGTTVGESGACAGRETVRKDGTGDGSDVGNGGWVREGEEEEEWVTKETLVKIFRAAQRRRRIEEERHGVLLRGFR